MGEQRNTVLVTVDSIRYDRCGFSGTDDVSTPTLDEIATEGLNFRTAIAPGSATPDSVPVSVTGEFPPMKTTNEYLDEWVMNQSRARQTLAERFSGQGYRTGAFTANPWASRYFGFDEGFDHFEDFFGDDESESLFSKAISEHSTLFEVGRNVNDWLKGQNMFMSWEAFYDDIITWATNTDRPYFLWVFLVDVHVPYYAGSEFRTQSRLMIIPANIWLFLAQLHSLGAPFDDVLYEAYDNCIRHTDEFLRRLRRDLRDDDPLIAIHGDHGDEFGEFDRYGHGSGLSEPLIHVPFLIDNGPERDINRQVSLSSLPDILLDLAIDGVDGADIEHRYSEAVTVSWIGRKVAIRGTDWKFVTDFASDSETMYTLDSDDGTESEWRDPPAELLSGARQLAHSAYADRAEKKRIVDAVENTIEADTSL